VGLGEKAGTASLQGTPVHAKQAEAEPSSCPQKLGVKSSDAGSAFGWVSSVESDFDQLSGSPDFQLLPLISARFPWNLGFIGRGCGEKAGAALSSSEAEGSQASERRALQLLPNGSAQFSLSLVISLGRAGGRRRGRLFSLLRKTLRRIKCVGRNIQIGRPTMSSPR
jgi:hypothetical protein